MLNAIAVSLTAYLLRKWGGIVGNSLQTKPVPKDSWVPGLPSIPGAPNEVLGLAVLALLAGVGYAVVLAGPGSASSCRATGASATAAVASGIDVRRMVVISMLHLRRRSPRWSGLPLLFGDTHSYGTTFQVRARASPASRSRCWAATTRSASRSARCCSPSSPSRAACWRSTPASPTTSSRSPRGCWCSAWWSPTRWSAATRSRASRAARRWPQRARRLRSRSLRSVRGDASMTVANDALDPEIIADTGRPAPRRRVPVWALAAGRVRADLVRPRHHRQQRARLGRHAARGDHRVHPDRAGRPRPASGPSAPAWSTSASRA